MLFHGRKDASPLLIRLKVFSEPIALGCNTPLPVPSQSVSYGIDSRTRNPL